MKHKTLFLLAFLSVLLLNTCTGQDAILVFDRKAPKKYAFKEYDFSRVAPTMIFQFFGGLAAGTQDVLTNHYSQADIFPQAQGEYLLGQGPQFWNPQISWRNKWAGGDPANGERFPLSSTFFVSITDAWHMADAIERNSMQFSIFTYRQPKPENRNFAQFFVDFALMKMAYSLGFNLTYELLRR